MVVLFVFQNSVTLNVVDVDISRNVLRVLGKGNKTRIVPIGRQSEVIIKDYISSKKFRNPSDPFFGK